MMAALTILTVSVFAQEPPNPEVNVAKQKAEKMKYSCPMHPDELSNKPGKCSKCGMDLTKSKKEQMKMVRILSRYRQFRLTILSTLRKTEFLKLCLTLQNC